jgi:stress response protein YsnF
VVSKDARIREELVISKDVNQRTETVSDTVRRTEVEVEDERVSGTGTGTSTTTGTGTGTGFGTGLDRNR